MANLSTLISSILTGPVGATGPIGSTGTIGLTGSTGAIGATGPIADPDGSKLYMYTNYNGL